MEVQREFEIQPDVPTAPLQPEADGKSARIRTSSLTILFGIAAVLFFVLAVAGTVRNYSPVPFWDMWDDYILFYLKIHAGDWSALWALHNEHRIILPRLFFWIDIAYFHGNGIFSLTVIYLSILAIGLVFAKIWQEQSRGQDLYILFFVEAWIFSWSQQQNLIWAFQSQFILAQLLPLASLFLLHSSYSKQDKTRWYFWAATLCGVLAVGSMANGVLALPALALYAAIAGRRLSHAVFFIVLSAIELHFYFQNFSASVFPGAAPTLTGEILRHPFGFIEFFLAYLGGPFIFLFNKTGFMPTAIRLGELCGASLVLMSTWALYVNLKQRMRASLPIALLLFIFYIMATAAITAAGRLPLGLGEALSSRYLTPALYGWAAALLLLWPAIAKSIRYRNIFSFSLAAFLCFIMLPRQLHALDSQEDTRFQRAFGALALELQIKDTDQIVLLYPNVDAVIPIANQARQQRLSIFGFPPLQGADLLLGHQAAVQPIVPCQGSWNNINSITDARYVRVSGWLFNAQRINGPQMIYLVDQTDKIIGLGFVGERRKDVAQAKGRRAINSGFEAYLSRPANGQRISVLSPDNGCVLRPVTARFN